MTVRTATALIIATGVVLAPVALEAHGVASRDARLLQSLNRRLARGCIWARNTW